MLACPRNVESAFALTPAAMKMFAHVCRSGWKPIGVSPAAAHARSARRATRRGSNGAVSRLSEDEPASAWRAEQVRGEWSSQGGYDRHRAGARSNADAHVADLRTSGVGPTRVTQRDRDAGIAQQDRGNGSPAPPRLLDGWAEGAVESQAAVPGGSRGNGESSTPSATGQPP